MKVYRASFDVDGDCPLSDLLESFDHCISEGESLKLVEWETDGPGGGNPCLTVESSSYEDLLKYLRVHYCYDHGGCNPVAIVGPEPIDEDLQWIMDHITEHVVITSLPEGLSVSF